MVAEIFDMNRELFEGVPAIRTAQNPRSHIPAFLLEQVFNFAQMSDFPNNRSHLISIADRI